MVENVAHLNFNSQTLTELQTKHLKLKQNVKKFRCHLQKQLNRGPGETGKSMEVAKMWQHSFIHYI